MLESNGKIQSENKDSLTSESHLETIFNKIKNLNIDNTSLVNTLFELSVKLIDNTGIQSTSQNEKKEKKR